MSSDNISPSTSVVYGKPVGGFGVAESGEAKAREGRELFKIGGVAIDCIRVGSGKPLLLLHGLHGRRLSLDLIDALAASFEVIAPSHPGFDGSPRDERIGNVGDLAEFYAEFREQVAPGCDVVGLSFGGWIAAQMAATVARDIRRLALVSPIGIKAGGREDRDYLDLYITDRDVILKGEYGERGRWPDYSAWPEDHFFELARAEEAVAWYAWQPYLHDPKLINRLRRVAGDVLVISGEEDGIILNPNIHEELVQAIGNNARRVIVPGEGHLIEATNPTAIATLITSFMAEDASVELASAQN